MLISDSNWFQVEKNLSENDQCVLPLGCTEQHAYLSLATDSILAQKISFEAALPLGVPVFPVLSYGLTPTFADFPGTLGLTIDTYGRVLHDLLDGVFYQGFRRIVIVNGHGGNSPVRARVSEWLRQNPDAKVKWHDWWNAPQTWAAVQATDFNASHASWMENFPWTRLASVDMPDVEKPMTLTDKLRVLSPTQMRQNIGDGNFGGRYFRTDEEMLTIWDVAVRETRDCIVENW